MKRTIRCTILLAFGFIWLLPMQAEAESSGLTTDSYITHLTDKLAKDIQGKNSPGKSIQNWELLSDADKKSDIFKKIYGCIDNVIISSSYSVLESDIRLQLGGSAKGACQNKFNQEIITELLSKRVKKLSELLTKEVAGLEMGEKPVKDQFVKSFENRFSYLERKQSDKTASDLILLALMVANSNENQAVEKTPMQKELGKINDKLERLEALAGKKKKKIIISEEIKQLNYMILGKSVKDFCAEYGKGNFKQRTNDECSGDDDDSDDIIKECTEHLTKAYVTLCENNQYELPSYKKQIDSLGAAFYSSSEKLQKFKELPNLVSKIDDLQTRLNHANWEKDMYWFGGSVMAVPSINAVTTGISMHVFPWYARAIQANLIDQDDGLRRFSIYFDVAAVTGQSDFKGRTYSSPSYGLGVGFDIREGFIIKAGTVYLKSSPVGGATGSSSYSFQPSFGVTITREFFQDLLN